jgi:hypothetical protein
VICCSHWALLAVLWFLTMLAQVNLLQLLLILLQ